MTKFQISSKTTSKRFDNEINENIIIQNIENILSNDTYLSPELIKHENDKEINAEILPGEKIGIVGK